MSKSQKPDAAAGAAQAAGAAPEAQPAPAPQGPLGVLAPFSDHQLAMVLTHEYPQTIALVLANLGDPRKAYAVLNGLPAELAVEVSERIAAISPVQPGVLEEVGAVIARELPAMGPAAPAQGLEALTTLLAASGEGADSALFKTIQNRNPSLAEKLLERIG